MTPAAEVQLRGRQDSVPDHPDSSPQIGVGDRDGVLIGCGAAAQQPDRRRVHRWLAPGVPGSLVSYVPLSPGRPPGYQAQPVRVPRGAALPH